MALGLSIITQSLDALLFHILHLLASLRILGLAFFNYLFVYHNNKSAFMRLVAELTALTKEHRYLVDFNHDVGEEELLAVHGLFLVENDRLSTTCHVCVS